MRRHPKHHDASHGERAAPHPQPEAATTIDNTRQTPSKKHTYNHDIEYFANHQFSRSFSSLIIEDADAQTRSKRVLNKSPPFNVKHTASISNALEGNSEDDIEGDTNVDFFGYGSDSDSELLLSSDHESRTDHGFEKRKPLQIHPQNAHNEGFSGNKALDDSRIFSGSLSPLKPPSKPLLKRSSKYFNLSIDVQGNSSPTSGKESRLTSSPLGERGTPFNKFKRPHQLVSQSPSPSSSHRLKVMNGSGSPSKPEKTSKMFKNSTSSRMKSPLRLGSSSSASSPTTEFCIKKLGKSPNLRFMSSSSPLKIHVFNETLGVYDESPSRPKRPSASNFHVYHDDDRVSSTMSKSHHDPYQTSSGTSAADSNKENESRKPVKTAKKASYKLVKPLQAAFESAGLKKKNSQPKFSKKAPPDTPMKRQPLVMITKETNKPHNYDTSFFDNDHSIEVGRNTSGVYLDSNDSNSSFFKFPSSTRSETKTKLDYADPLDFDLDIIPETPTKSSSRGKKLNLLIKDKVSQFPPKPEGVFETDPCTPISQFPTDSLLSSQATLSLPNAHGDLSSNDRTVTYPTANLDHVHDPIKPETILAERDPRDERLLEKFGKSNIRYVGSGQFSVAFECNFQNQKFAIKRNKKPISSHHEKKAIMREIDALKALTSFREGETEVEEGKENLVFFVEAWSSNNFFYIMTEFCEGGTLNDFLDDHRNYKVDEFRVWKILIEILSGLKYIHSKNYLHLDLKPANIFVTFDGSLKIGDFGLSAKLPITEDDFDLEGDKGYIAPELINDNIYTPYADIFSVGVIIVEIATNIIIPGNGSPWKKLRSGDLSDAGRLSSDNISDFLNHRNFSSITSYDSSFQSINALGFNQNVPSSYRSGISCSRSVPEQSFGTHLSRPNCEYPDKPSAERLRELIPKGAPQFLLDNSGCLDSLVRRMMQENPFDRMTASDILMRKECLEIEARRKAGATIFEGEFGPNDD